MKKLIGSGVLAALALLAFSPSLIKADTYNYNLTFTETDGNGISAANGQLDIVGGYAVGGYLDVTAGPAQGTYDLYTWAGGGTSSVRVTGGTDLIVDNAVTVGGNPFLDIYGLAFTSPGDTEGIDFSLDSGTTYNLGGFGTFGYYVPNANGSATLSAVPETSSTLALLGCSFGAIISVRRRLAR
jgi:hypothetical protein